MPRQTKAYVATHNHPDRTTTILGVAKTMASAVRIGDTYLTDMKLTRGDLHPEAGAQWATTSDGGFIWFSAFTLED